MDGIIFSKDHATIITDELTENLSETTHVQRFSDAKDPWYYLHVEENLFYDRSDHRIHSYSGISLPV